MCQNDTQNICSIKIPCKSVIFCEVRWFHFHETGFFTLVIIQTMAYDNNSSERNDVNEQLFR